MRYLLIETSPWPNVRPPWWVRFLQKVIPAANPDLEHLYPHTSHWWLEIDDDGKPQREIGFDENGEAVVLGPIGRNFGFLVDSSDDCRDLGVESVDVAAKFETQWSDIHARLRHLDVI